MYALARKTRMVHIIHLSNRSSQWIFLVTMAKTLARSTIMHKRVVPVNVVEVAICLIGGMTPFFSSITNFGTRYMTPLIAKLAKMLTSRMTKSRAIHAKRLTSAVPICMTIAAIWNLGHT